MKLRQYFVTDLVMAAAVALTLGCSDAPGPASEGVTPSKANGGGLDAAAQDDTAALEDVEQEVSEAAAATHDFAAQEMQDYANSLQKKLDELNSQLVQLQQQGQDLAGDAQQRWEDRLSALQEQRQELQKDLDELGDASGDVWRELKEGLDAAWADLKNATDQAAKEFE